MNPDGSSPVQLTQYVSAKNGGYTIQYGPSWSPDGAFLAYTEYVKSSSKSTYNIRRVASGGGGIVSLTTDNTSRLTGWRP